jgi:hypothetical protein
LIESCDALQIAETTINAGDGKTGSTAVRVTHAPAGELAETSNSQDTAISQIGAHYCKA